MRFRPSNRIRYGQDFGQFSGIPSGVNFSVEEFCEPGMFILKGPGYGEPGNYGSGALYVWGLNEGQRRRFDAAVRKGGR